MIPGEEVLGGALGPGRAASNKRKFICGGNLTPYQPAHEVGEGFVAFSLSLEGSKIFIAIGVEEAQPGKVAGWAQLLRGGGEKED